MQSAAYKFEGFEPTWILLMAITESLAIRPVLGIHPLQLQAQSATTGMMMAHSRIATKEIRVRDHTRSFIFKCLDVLVVRHIRDIK